MMGDWRGKPHEQIPRCGAKTRLGDPCQRFAMSNGRCEFHGGKSTGPKDLRKWHLKHGRFSKDSIAERRVFAALVREAREVLEAMEFSGELPP